MARILLVDDDIDIRRLVKRILDSVGHSVVVVDNGLTALDELNANIYDLLISDANMPRYSGFDLIRALKKQSRHRKLAIAMLTGRREVQDIQHAIGLGVNEYIIKPIDPKVLIEKVQKLIESKQGAAEPIQTKPLNAFLQSPLEIAEFDGSGFKGRSTTAFPIGSEVQFRSPELNEAGIKVRTVKIINCKALPDSDDSYYIQAEFVGLDDEALYDIEEFIQYRKAS